MSGPAGAWRGCLAGMYGHRQGHDGGFSERWGSRDQGVFDGDAVDRDAFGGGAFGWGFGGRGTFG
ncbi:hypothetical protein SAMN05446589_5098 [Streptomyces sp. OV198]|nr:hypothetical protein SAMN05446589_5098 [Streptomyces sp. OV198]